VVARGEVRWLLIDKQRPVVLLNRDAVINRLNSWLVAPCTSRRRGLPTEVPLDGDDGIDRPCVISLDNVTLVDRDLVGSLIATLAAAKMTAVCEALAIAVGCDR
jgi:mRNA interferase MazF